MPLFLQQRSPHLRERMDDPDCDRGELFNTYRQFSVINTLISRWRTIYKQYIRPYALANGHACSILDIGFGGGDLPIKLERWCAADDIHPSITAIETDDRAIEFVKSIDHPENITFLNISSADMVRKGHHFDFVISNHLLHHLDSEVLEATLEEAKNLSRYRVLFNDIERSDIGYLLFNLFSRPVFRSSFITEDGLTSIKRSYTKEELVNNTPNNWEVERIFPYRLLLTYCHE